MKSNNTVIFWAFVVTAISASAQTPVIQSLSRNGIIRWTGDQSHGAYQIQWTSTLDDPGPTDWRMLAMVAANDGVTSAEVPMFFRLTALDPDFKTNGLVAHYSLDGHAMDDGPHDNHGSAASVTFVADRFGVAGRAMEFPADDSVVTVPRSPSLDLTGDVTLCAWVKPGPVDGFRTIIDKEWEAEGYDLYIIWSLYHTRFGDDELNSGRVDPGKWAFVVSIREGEEVTLYINGQRVGESWAGNLPVRNKGLFIGNCGNTPRPFGGAIDDIRIYSRALSPVEILTLYHAP